MIWFGVWLVAACIVAVIIGRAIKMADDKERPKEYNSVDELFGGDDEGMAG